jgi:hypothetical protein
MHILGQELVHSPERLGHALVFDAQVETGQLTGPAA